VKEPLRHSSADEATMPPSLRLVSDYAAYGAQAFPGRPALIEGDKTWTYAQAATEIDRIARAMMAAGVVPGDRVATLAPPSALAWKLFLAAASIGACWIGLNPRYSRFELAHPLSDSAPRILLTEQAMDGRDYYDELAGIIAEAGLHTSIISLPGDNQSEGAWQDFLSQGSGVPEVALQMRRAEIDPHDACLIVYTSGTTGTPKGAMLTHHGLVFCSRTDARYNLHADGQRMLCNFPINHIACIGDVCMTTLVAGGTVVFMRKFDPAGILKTVAERRITHLGQIPVMLQMILDQPDFGQHDLSSLRVIMWGGNPASIDLVRRLRALCPNLCNVYGMTETTGNVIFARVDLTDEQFAASVGFPPGEYSVEIRAADGALANAGETGEIHVRGDFLMKGYWRNPEATKAAFTPDGWLKTGDLAMRREDGLIALVGRRSEMFKSGGYNVYPVEIEQAIEAHPGVALAAVVSVADPLYAEVGVGFVIPNRTDIDETTLQAHCRERLANYKIPKRFCIVDSLPMLPNGKVDRKTLKQLAGQA
jgi:acyl-CoA synthetase (AMP-forming)/AMP-acid ligase II